MMPQSLLRIRYKGGRGRMDLILPNFFANATLEDIRKVMKLLKDHPDRNERAHETLERFFPAWAPALKDCLVRAISEQERLERELHDIYSRSQAAKKLKKDLKLATDKVKRTKNNLERYGKIVDLYKTIKAQEV